VSILQKKRIYLLVYGKRQKNQDIITAVFEGYERGSLSICEIGDLTDDSLG
jgi:hypothetical protein